jgi:hypothetical protein
VHTYDEHLALALKLGVTFSTQAVMPKPFGRAYVKKPSEKLHHYKLCQPNGP